MTTEYMTDPATTLPDRWPLYCLECPSYRAKQPLPTRCRVFNNVKQVNVRRNGTKTQVYASDWRPILGDDGRCKAFGRGKR